MPLSEEQEMHSRGHGRAAAVRRAGSAPAAAQTMDHEASAETRAGPGKRKMEFGHSTGGHQGEDQEEHGEGPEGEGRVGPVVKRACRRGEHEENPTEVTHSYQEDDTGRRPRRLAESHSGSSERSLRNDTMDEISADNSLFRDFSVVSQQADDLPTPLSLPPAPMIPDQFVDKDAFLAWLNEDDDELDDALDLFNEAFSDAMAESHFEASRRDWWREDALWTLKKVDIVTEYPQLRGADAANNFMDGLKRRMFLHRPIGCRRHPPLWKTKVCPDVVVCRPLKFSTFTYVRQNRPRSKTFRVRNKKRFYR